MCCGIQDKCQLNKNKLWQYSFNSTTKLFPYDLSCSLARSKEVRGEREKTGERQELLN